MTVPIRTSASVIPTLHPVKQPCPLCLSDIPLFVSLSDKPSPVQRRFLPVFLYRAFVLCTDLSFALWL